ncbi:MAG: IS66 family transposase, partial [Candidatus Omnitrophica bacterium]|nr:IS66 family transposase [Candidatus Omnitrophota bacterium]
MGDREGASILEGIDLKHLNREEAERIVAQGPEAIVFALLQLSALARGNEASSPSTPSSQIPPYLKENSRKRKKKPGGKPGHEGARRSKPDRVDRVEEHTLEKCPDCGEAVAPPSEKRTRVIEDIPVTQPEVVEHVIPRCWCKSCRKMVEPVIPDALPKAELGHRALALSAWFHYGLGNTLSQVSGVLDTTFQHSISTGGLIDAWQRIAMIVEPWYHEIADRAFESATLHADETGHRVAGQTHWLWCFTTPEVTYYHIDDSRGEKALREFFLEAYEGVLITDFWGAYNRIAVRKRQLCLVHLLRELDKVDLRNGNEDWIDFRNLLKRLLKDAIRLSKRDDLTAEEFAAKRNRLDLRLKGLIDGKRRDPDAKRLIKRLKKHRHDLFTFLDEPDVPFDNNHAEREIRPAVLMRKNSFHNMSDEGALVHSIMMTVFRTLKRKGFNPVDTLVHSLREFVTTGQLPSLAEATT